MSHNTESIKAIINIELEKYQAHLASMEKLLNFFKDVEKDKDGLPKCTDGAHLYRVFPEVKEIIKKLQALDPQTCSLNDVKAATKESESLQFGLRFFGDPKYMSNQV